MDNSERYRKELDLIFQELDEKEQLRKQAESMPYIDFINGLLGEKSVQRLLSALPVDAKRKVIEDCWRAKIAYDEKSKGRAF